MSKVTFETPKYKVKVKMESDECFCGITAFYEFLAKQLGFGEKVYDENTLFDCKRLKYLNRCLRISALIMKQNTWINSKMKMDLLSRLGLSGFGMGQKQRFQMKDMLRL